MGGDYDLAFTDGSKLEDGKAEAGYTARNCRRNVIRQRRSTSIRRSTRRRIRHSTEYKAQHKAERDSAASGNIWDVGPEYRGEARYQSMRQNGRIRAMKRKEITKAQSI